MPLDREMCSCASSCLHIVIQEGGTCKGQLKFDGTRAETRFRLSAKRTSPFKSREGASVQSTTGSRGVRISVSNAGYTVLRGSVKSTGYPLHSTVSPSLPFPSVTVCHHISTGLYYCPFKREGTLGRCHTEKKTFSSSPYCYFQELPSPAIAYITGNKFVIS